jgi:hypothetical protein
MHDGTRITELLKAKAALESGEDLEFDVMRLPKPKTVRPDQPLPPADPIGKRRKRLKAKRKRSR